MKSVNLSIPLGIVFKKYYCSKCGAELKKEKTHRVVTKDDKDYYQYHDIGKFPRRDYNVYDYRMKCPSCNARVSYDEQCILERIQKKRGHRVLTSNEIKDNYKECKKVNSQRVLYKNVAFSIAINIIAALIIYFLNSDRTPRDLVMLLIIFSVLAVISVIRAVKKHKGTYKLKFKQSYSYEEEARLNKLQAYSSHNRAMVEASERCYCYYCKSSMESGEIVDYSDEGQTAKCPNCGSETVIPDSVDEPVDEKVIIQMNEYWF